ncbi:MAG: DUF2029 domain-containing protein [Rhizobiaceae bacterium]|nr:DUF2029 domain-containing protein [Rhizobiaceae bacterium]
MTDDVAGKDEVQGRTRKEMQFAMLVAAAGLVIGLRYYAELWVFEPNGLSRLSDRLPYWDFTNLWAGTRMAIEGHVAWLFDMESYRAGLRAMFSPDLPDQEWSYPPSMLLIGLVPALLPIFWAYLVWTAGTIAAFRLSLRLLPLPAGIGWAVALSPAVVTSAIFGQNGALTAALLVSSLALSRRNPLLSGILAGLLTVKPHLGILLPFAFMASGNWRAFLSAALTAGLMVVVTGSVFGFEVWQLFYDRTRPLMSAIMEAPYPQLYHANALTFFILGRSLGLSVNGSYLFQAVFTLASILAVVWMWRRASEVRFADRVVLTALLTICATPYGYTYDAAPYSLAVAWFFVRARSPNRYVFCLLWIYPYLAHLPNFNGIGAGILVPAGLAAYGLREVLRDSVPKTALTAS